MRARMTKKVFGHTYLLAATVSTKKVWFNPNKVKKAARPSWVA